MVVKNKLIGSRIRELREQQHLSQADLASEVNVSVSYISHIENGNKQASIEIYITIANVLGVTVDELLYGNQVNDPTAYQTDMDIILSDCNNFEKKVIYEMSKTLKMIIRDNIHLMR